MLGSLIQQQVDDLVDGIQAAGGFNAGSKRRKALSKFSNFYFGPQEPELSVAQVEQVLIGDYGSTAPVGRRKRTGLVHLAGLLKKKTGGKVSLTQSAVAALELLDRVVVMHPELASGPVFNDVFSKLPLDLVSQMQFDLHAQSSRSKSSAFRLAECVIRQNRRNAQDPDQVRDDILVELFKDDDAFDAYLEWEGGYEEDATVHSEEAAPEEWDHVMIADGSDDEDIEMENVTQKLLASVQKNADPTLLLSPDGNVLAPLGGATAETNTAAKSFKHASGEIKVLDPLRILQDDLRSLELDSSRKSTMPGGLAGLSAKSTTNGAASKALNVATRSPEAQEDSSSPLPSPPASTSSASPSAADKKSKRKRFRDFFHRKNKKNGSGRGRADSAASIGSMGSGVGESLTRATSQASLSPPVQAKQSKQPHVPQDQNPNENGRANAWGPDLRAEREALIRAIQERNNNQQAPLSILPSSERFDPSLFLWSAHRNTSMSNLLLGLNNIDADNEDQKTSMKALVYDNFDEFVHCRSTIGHIQTLMQQEVGARSERRHTRHGNSGVKGSSASTESQSWTMKIGKSLDLALETSDEHFVPLLQKRKRVRKLRRAAEMLKRLEYLWQLPHQLRQLMGEYRWIEAVIEFANAGQHLEILDKSTTSGSETLHSGADFTKDAVRDLENCGVALCEALLEKLKKPADLPSAALTISQTTSDLLQGEQHGNLICTEALSLLLELRDHVPKTNRIFHMLDMDGDPFLVLAQTQQRHAADLLTSVQAKVASNCSAQDCQQAFSLANEITFEYLRVWEDARVCLDPSSASSGKEHIFDVLNRVKGEGGSFATSNGAPTLSREDSINQDDEEELLQPLRSRLQRSGSVDLLFDIRKRSAANCSLEDLAERRKASDQMAFEILSHFISVVESLVHQALADSNTSLAIELLLGSIRTMRKVRQKGAINSALHARGRLLRQITSELDQTDLKQSQRTKLEQDMAALERMDLLCVFEELATATLTKRFETLGLMLEERAANSNGLAQVRAVQLDLVGNAEKPRLHFVASLIVDIAKALRDTRALLQSPEGVAFWREGFLRDQAKEISKTLPKYIKLLCEWISATAKAGPDVEVVPVLFADCNYCRVVFMDQMQAMLQLATDPQFTLVAKSSKETLAMQLKRQLLRIEESLMAQYVQKRGKGIEALLVEAFQFDGNIADWPSPPSSMRHYTLDVLLLFANVVAESTRYVGQDGSRQLLCGLTRQLAQMFESGVQDIKQSLQQSPGAVTQLQAEVTFLETVLTQYESPKSMDSFAATKALLDQLYGNDEEQRTPSDRHVINTLVESVMKNALITALCNNHAA